MDQEGTKRGIFPRFFILFDKLSLNLTKKEG